MLDPKPDGGTPIQKLAVAVIIRAIQDYYKVKAGKIKLTNYITDNRRSYLELEEFFADDKFDDPEPFSFPWLCMVVSDRPEVFRQTIVQFIQSNDLRLIMFARGRPNYTRKFMKSLLH